MKKFFAILLAVVAFAASANAQSKAIGLRGGYGVEVSYQHYMGGANFLEADLGLTGFAGDFYLTGVYDFNLGNSGPFNFYAGPGASVGFYTYHEGDTSYLKMSLALVAQVGCEFQIPNVPLALSLDWRPAFYLLNPAFGWQGFGFGVRYTF